MSDRPHWSYSSLAQYLRCPLQYYFERVVHLERVTTPMPWLLVPPSMKPWLTIIAVFRRGSFSLPTKCKPLS